MAIETKEKVIGEHVYSVTQMPAMRAVKLQARLLKMIGPSFGAMMASDPANPDSSLPLAISLLADKLDEKTFSDLVIHLTESVRRNGAEMTKERIDSDFAGNLNELFLVMQFVLEVNFSDFFREGGIIAGLIKASRKETASTLPPDSKNS